MIFNRFFIARKKQMLERRVVFVAIRKTFFLASFFIAIIALIAINEYSF